MKSGKVEGLHSLISPLTIDDSNFKVEEVDQVDRCDNPIRDNFVLSPKPLLLVIKR
jgi:hypothetical protein